MKWLVYMYPKRWRRRYGNELIEVLKQTDLSFKTIMDLLSGIVDAWHLELSERDIYAYRISQVLVVITLINAFIILKLKPLKEVILVEQIATVTVFIAMVSLFLSIATFIVSLFKFGVKEGFSLKTKLTKISIGLMGTYVVFIATFIALIN
ncbi:hypothetical protein COE15_25130 [Bacillus cereus]|uniref:hypothetical protein n=1 Tax=Bacillus sp. AFS023182 TaxID=2033492 RepID=UPI000BF4231D|nr:hypothetical protein [Bacillus sp. AFS023182]PFE04546.1 hypothetical protein CN288_08005 [Bacillus sp. AFS023182]PGX91571.1 hypothetical protein COE15_25130 [Bacillus cereus]